MAKKLCISPAASTPPQATVAKTSQKAFLSTEATGVTFRSNYFSLFHHYSAILSPLYFFRFYLNAFSFSSTLLFV